jgi:two-component system CheB/CheR fusion protein
MTNAQNDVLSWRFDRFQPDRNGHSAGFSPANLDAGEGEDGVDDLVCAVGKLECMQFSSYKQASLLRRIKYRMKCAGIVGFPAYRAVLESDPDEQLRLCETVPVLRTEFFRDPEEWVYLANEVAPGLALARRADEPIRAWSAGCATGEEAYTLAIVLAEATGPHALARGHIKVFATDLSERAISTARAGSYWANRMPAIPEELRNRYFQPYGEKWVVRPELRAALIFAQHDLLRHPPLPNQDLIVCRNTLIYFTRDAQIRTLARLYLGLRAGGRLFTGSAEDPRIWTELFQAECFPRRVYGRIPGRSLEALDLAAWDRERRDSRLRE